jgi:hypothetical protein
MDSRAAILNRKDPRMSEASGRSWDEALSALRDSAGELKRALTHIASKTEDAQPTTGRLKQDLERLVRAGAKLQTTFLEGFERQRPDIVSHLDRERAEQTAQQLKASVEELATLAVDVTIEVAAAAQSSLKQAEPELRTAARSLEDLASSVATWIANSIDSGRGGSSAGQRKPPLDEM